MFLKACIQKGSSIISYNYCTILKPVQYLLVSEFSKCSSTSHTHTHTHTHTYIHTYTLTHTHIFSIWKTRLNIFLTSQEENGKRISNLFLQFIKVSWVPSVYFLFGLTSKKINHNRLDRNFSDVLDTHSTDQENGCRAAH